jgi:hypothetical protein
MNALKYLMLALQYLPFVLGGVQAVEGSIGQTDGKTKKQIVLSAVSAAAQVAGQVPEDHVKLVSGLIDAVVGQLNASGVFSHKASTVDGTAVVVPK